MRLVALDTSSPILSCALVEDDRILAEAQHHPPAKAGDLLPQALLDICGGSFEGVQGIAVGIGPGSFTGLRVGLACAKSLAYALKIPLAGASSLRAMAGPGLVCAALEARKGELFIALYRERAEVWPEQVIRAADLPGKLRALGEPVAVAEPPPRAAEIARLCLPRLAGASFDAEACFALAPNYLQPSTAEVALAEGRVGGLPR
ncbi:MAG: tRNA (adenosine(37)-N6)-threonylcarbamoyltransferase complex dimerization subunit type 1 TsaB [Deltaproteobacteria bacterium]|nr:MAG: tRNA (adenosine(37)-N6)-threonylcarbamoyltransferase complex dimerization subunit type 1 TsaB [Deltaproteobacteria bacterium]